MSGQGAISRRFIRVWQRNWTVYLHTWKISFIPPLLEPLFYLLAFGVGLSALVGTVIYRGGTISYVAVNIMNGAFFENTYASFVRMFYQKTFDAILATPLTLSDIITGEILWGATKSVIGTAIMMGVISCFGYIRFPDGLLLLPVALLGGTVFGAIGMLFTAMVPNIETFNLPVFLFITPMFLFSGTFFPLANLPAWARTVAFFLPLTHVVELARALAFGVFYPGLLGSTAYLLLLCLVAFPLAIRKMQKRLVR
jgi:lipooligosaccharide transport system permease protein